MSTNTCLRSTHDKRRTMGALMVPGALTCLLEPPTSARDGGGTGQEAPPPDPTRTEAGHATAAKATAGGRSADLGMLFTKLYRAEQENLALAEIAGVKAESAPARNLVNALSARSQPAETEVLTVAGTHGFDEPRLRYLFAFTENRSDAEVRQADVARLRRASGADFDAAFGTAAARALNRQIAAIRKAIAEGVDSEVKGLLDRLLPELEASAHAAERLSPTTNTRATPRACSHAPRPGP